MCVALVLAVVVLAVVVMVIRIFSLCFADVFVSICYGLCVVKWCCHGRLATCHSCCGGVLLWVLGML